MLSHILLVAAHLPGKRPDMTAITGHKEVVELTGQRAAAMTELCSIKSIKGPVQLRWLSCTWRVFESTFSCIPGD